MIRIKEIEVEGVSSKGPFSGSLSLKPGLNVISAKNAYGKSLAVTAIPWCLGLEGMFGLADNDPSRFPLAVRDALDLAGERNVDIEWATARLTLQRDDNATIILCRPIKGSDPELVDVIEAGSSPRTSRLQARRRTMKDGVGGLQHFLFQWLSLSRAPLMNMKGEKSELYLENLGSLFFIDQNEGWTDLQALQVYRYQLQEVCEAAVEYLLGASKALNAKFQRQESVSRDARLKGEAQGISKQVEEFFRRSQGWAVKMSTHGAPQAIAERWAERPLGAIAKEKHGLDAPAERGRLEARIAALRAKLTSDPLGSPETAPSTQASQLVVELKTRRHQLRSSLRDTRMQLADQHSLFQTIEHRIHSSKDVLRLKMLGIGRLEMVECPTCHRDLDPSTFELSAQSEESVQAHIASLEKQQSALKANIRTLEADIIQLTHALSNTDEHLVAADRSLTSVNQAVGSVRERLMQVAADLAAAEREYDALNAFTKELASLEASVTQWQQDAQAVVPPQLTKPDLAWRVKIFEQKLRTQLLALGFSAVDRETVLKVSLDDRYVPYLGPRRLRSLGSASDHARLVAAYVVALAEASIDMEGPHPGFVVLDEPLQQNPDPKHRERMIKFFMNAKDALQSQVIVTTSLRGDELAQLKTAGVQVTELKGKHFLQPRSRSKKEKISTKKA